MKNVKKFIFVIIIIMTFFYSSINVSSKDSALLNVEFPTTNNIGSSLTVSGWAMSTYENAVKVYIDDNLVGEASRIERLDVLNAIKDYGSELTNALPGFTISVDMSNYKDGNHILSVRVCDKNDNILTQNDRKIVVEKYKSLLNVEEPNISNISGTTLKLGGWLMTTSSNIGVRAYIDKDEITNIDRIERQDVLNAIKGYGDITTNKTPGFSKNVDLSSLDDGKHTLKVQLYLIGTDEVFLEEVKTFKLEKYKTLLNVESPNQTNINSSFLNVSGWVMSKNSNAEIKIYLGDNEINTIDRIERQDVLNAIKGYGDITTNKTPGFSKDIDLASFKDGTYQLKVKVVDKVTNALMDEITKKVVIKKYVSKLNVENPSNTNIKGSSISVNGWVMSTDKNATIVMMIDDILVENVSREERRDVLNAVKGYGDITTNKTPGFSKTIDVSSLKDGVHKIVVKVVDSITSEILTQSEIKVSIKKYNTISTIESPSINATVKTTITLTGWTMTTAAAQSLELYVDGIKVENPKIERFYRSDTLNALSGYGDITTNPTAGYRIVADTSNYKDGLHSFEVRVIDSKTGEAMHSFKQNIIVKKYNGLLTVESPGRSNFNTGFTVSGWEMSELDNSYIKIYLDGKDLSLNVIRDTRGDVLNTITGYGGISMNKTPGFSAYLDLASINEGDHTLTVKLYSRLNDELARYDKKIVVYKKVYFGIDVSAHNGLINWPIVKKEGIDFSIVRLGFRGYGISGTVNLDTQYLNNIHGVINNNIPLGIYFYSQAISEEEARNEANFVLDNIRLAGISNNVKYPIIFDTEYSDASPEGRADRLSKMDRTRIARAFLDTIRNAGYKPMIYSNKAFLYDNLDMSSLADYDVWVAHYNGTSDPVQFGTDYTGPYHMWQYTSSGYVNGINGRVDLNLSYKKY